MDGLGSAVTVNSAPAAALRRAAVRERAATLLLAAPALVFVAFLLVVPMAWLTGLSFMHNGAFSFANYIRVFTDRFYANSYALTLIVAATVTAITGFYGYLLAYALTLMPRWASGICLALVALPFWTSILVRSYAWLTLLQTRGVINNLLIKLGVIDAPLRMVYNMTGTLIGMVHIMLPLMIFPVYAGLLRIDPDYVKAARALGASPSYAFWRVYFPLSLPGLAAGALMVFVLSLGFYVTPALLGGGHIPMMSIVLENDVTFNNEWGPASAIAVLFLLVVLALFSLGSRIVSLDRVFRG